MNKSELVSQIESIQTSIKSLSSIKPNSYDEFNDLRLQFDNLNLQLQSVHMLMDTLVVIEQLNSVNE